ncbi:MAG: anaerobic ribonucleoside-triphosphate reductase [Alphaproteobacteria bacterium]|nr:anaerobic ribonucleoside-triphosphate reductase [Alphaproteobacteria bacterium]MBQ3514429.1 anaerobic ribonucleoside-triphosphate reductase [Lachnospiraceae bacterium]
MAKVIRRNCTEDEFKKEKISNAILKAMTNGSGIVKPKIAEDIANEIYEETKDIEEVSISEIEQMVFDKLISKKQRLTARAYEGYRSIREFQREENELDDVVYGIVEGTDKEVLDENSNKNAYIAPTQRDLIAGELSRNYSRRNLLPINITQAHDEGIIHFHDADYFVQHIHNCQLVNLEDMLQNGTVINTKMIEKPKSFQTACTVATQIVQQVANSQYGGQTITLSHLAPFVRISYEKQMNRLKKKFGKQLYKKYFDEWNEKFSEFGESARNLFREFLTYQMLDMAKEETDELIKAEIKAGIQTIQFQVNTFNTSNGQSPFLTVFMYISENPEYEKETAMLIEEVLNQRYEGMKNEVGVPVTPSFPKLIFVLDENNVSKDSEYYYLKKLACKCVAKRMMPDFISAKIMKQNYDGEVFPCMGCRSFLSNWKDENGKYKWYGRFNQGVVTLNLVDVGLSADKDMDKFWNILDERLRLCYQALMLRHERLEGTSTTISPIHWQYGAIARLSKDDKIDDLLHNGYSTISLGYAGLYECVLAMLGVSHTTEEGEKFALAVMNKLKATCDKWKKDNGIGFGLYGTPLESTTYKFARKLRDRFGVIEGITDKDYITNSYHVNVREEIDAFRKLGFEAQFQKISSGGAVSYVEVTNLNNNLDAIEQIVDYMYDTIQYAEINTKSDYCQVCCFDGEILLDENLDWYCPNCGNRDHKKMNVCRRTCGYLGDNFWNRGRTQDINDRYIHLDNHIMKEGC